MSDYIRIDFPDYLSEQEREITSNIALEAIVSAIGKNGSLATLLPTDSVIDVIFNRAHDFSGKRCFCGGHDQRHFGRGALVWPPGPGSPGFSSVIDPVTGVCGMDALDPTNPYNLLKHR